MEERLKFSISQKLLGFKMSKRGTALMSLTTIEDSVNLNDLTYPFAINTLTKKITEGSSEITSHYDGLTRTSTLTSKLGRSIATQLDSLERRILEQPALEMRFYKEVIEKVKGGALVFAE